MHVALVAVRRSKLEREEGGVRGERIKHGVVSNSVTG